MGRLDGQVAWICGASGAIGAETSRVLAREGARVVLSSRNTQALDRLAGEIAQSGAPAPLAIATDISQRAQVDAAIARIERECRRVDILVNSVAITTFGDFLELADEDWLAVLQAKQLGYVRTMRAVLPLMLRQGGGRIVNVSGRGGHQPTTFAHFPGCSANAAVNLLTKGISLRYGADGIRANAVAPGPVSSGRYDQLAAANAAVNTSSTPVVKTSARKGEPADIADIIAFLVSDASRHLNGIVVQADGGGTTTL
ncbi:MAG: SDR family oxidoreductase [Burkholderiales bacterium]